MTNTSWKNELKKPEYDCPKCKVRCWIVGFYTDAGGQPKYPFVCMNCGHRTQDFAKRKAVIKSEIEVHQLSPKLLPFICEACHKEGAEEHHWAPYHIFGNEADRWPKSFLCKHCHDLWHKLVTPNASNTKEKA